jgi:phosphoglycolate phosphatase-like HAD superfamily hydrolase
VTSGPYRTWIFDCDGVLLDSNQVKARAIYEAALPHGEEAAAQAADHHRANGGLSRFEKLRYLFESVLGREDYGADLERALALFADMSRRGLISAPEAEGLGDLLARIDGEGALAFVVSGGMEEEVRGVLEARGLARRFAGIFGSPDSKDRILARELDRGGAMARPAVYVGDSRYDFEAARRQGLDFVFVSGWTEFTGWRDYFAGSGVTIVEGVADLVHARL